MLSMTTAAHGAQLANNGGKLCLAFGLCSTPLWLPSLSQVSATAGHLAPIVGFLIGLVTLYRVMKGDDEAKIRQSQLASFDKMASAAGAAARRGGPIAAAALAVIAIGTAVFMRSRPRKALADDKPSPLPGPAPLPLPTPAGVPATKKLPKSADDAGELETISVKPVIVKGEPGYMAFARGMLGEHEGTKKNPNKKVQALYAACGFPQYKDTTAVAWCAAFVGGSLKSDGVEPPRSLMAASYDTFQDEVEGGLANAKVGDIVRIWRTSPTSGLGHVGFFVKREGSKVFLLGGNQSDSVTIAAFPVDRVRAVRRVRPLTKSRVMQGSALSLFGTVATGVTAAAVFIGNGLQAAQPLHGPLRDMGTHWGDVAAAWLMLLSVGASVVGSLYAMNGRAKPRKKK